jgi:hypothetical protein
MNGTSSGNLSGHIRNTESWIKVNTITVDFDFNTAYALCNLLMDSDLKKSHCLERDQVDKLSSLGAALGRIVEHPSRENEGVK